MMTHHAWFAKPEPELRSLYEWIDRQQYHVGDARGGWFGAIVGSVWGVLGGAMGLLAGMQVNPAISVGIPVVLGCAGTGAALAWYLKGRSQADRHAAKAYADMRGFYWQLLSARHHGGIAALIGTERAAALNQGAFEFLRCHTALNSTSWQAAGQGSAWGTAREKTQAAMQLAMARLVTMVGQGATGDDKAVVRLLDDMKRAADEASATATRLAGHRGLPGDASDELRNVLGELRALNEADEEVAEMTERQT